MAQGEGSGAIISESTLTEAKDMPNADVMQSNPLNVTEQTTTFHDKADVYSLKLDAERDPTYNDGYEDNVPLGDFLSRPVDIYKDTWSVGYATSNYQKEFDPWTLWQSDARVKAKLENFAYASFDLKLRFMLNGSPFQYGRLMIVYIPYGAGPASATADVRLRPNQTAQAAQQWYNSTASGRVETTFQHFSTYPHAFLNPSTNQVVEMTLPFIWHNNFFAVNGDGVASKESCGHIRVYDLNPLRIANTSAPTTCNYQVFAWAENMKLHTPTDFVPISSKSGFSSYSSFGGSRTGTSADEYADGPVSSTASAVASAAGALNKAPVIGRFARATEIGAGAVANVARLFGFSAPAMVEPPARYEPKNHGRLANLQGEDSSYSLALDAKQEITVDPRTVGVRAEDEMAISSIITREQFLARCEWRGANGQFTTGGADKIIFASLVSPNQPHRTGTGTGFNSQTWQCVQDTPAGMVANLFDHWRGSITYRVECVATKMHAGRLKLQFDPFIKTGVYTVGDVNTDDVNTRHTLILDLNEASEVEFTIPYVNRRAWLQTLNDDSVTMFQPYRTDLTTFDLQDYYNPDVHMGIFTVSVVNELVAPIQTNAAASDTHAPIQVNVYFKCGEDMQFAMPSENNSRWAEMNYVPVSASTGFEDDSQDEPVTSMALFGVHDNPEGPKVFFGERVVSIRALIKRFGVVFTGRDQNTGSGQVGLFLRLLPHTNATVMRGKARRHSYLSYLMPAYAIGRGSTRYKTVYLPTNDVSNTGALQWMAVERFASRNDVSTINPANKYLDLTSNSTTSAQITDHMIKGFNGAAFTSCSQNTTLEFQLPFYSNTRYFLANQIVNVDNDTNETAPVNYTMTQVLFAKLYSSARFVRKDIQQQWFAAGDDFSLSFFCGVPQIWYHQGSV